jgi:hypothetical protein
MTLPGRGRRFARPGDTQTAQNGGLAERPCSLFGVVKQHSYRSLTVRSSSREVWLAALITVMPALTSAQTDSVCGVLLVAIQTSVPRAWPIRVMAAAETGGLELLGSARQDQVDNIANWADAIGVDRATVRRVLQAPGTEPTKARLPQCQSSRGEWGAITPAPDTTDIVTVKASFPVFLREGRRAIVYVAWLQGLGPSSNSLSSGPLGSGDLYLLQLVGEAWTIRRAVNIWTRLRE